MSARVPERITGPSTMPAAPNTNRPPTIARNTGNVCSRISLPHEERVQHVVDGADDQQSPAAEYGGLPPLPLRGEDRRDRQPDHERPTLNPLLESLHLFGGLRVDLPADERGRQNQDQRDKEHAEARGHTRPANPCDTSRWTGTATTASANAQTRPGTKGLTTSAVNATPSVVIVNNT